MHFLSNVCSRLILVAFLACPAIHAEMVTLFPVADTTLFEHDPNNNMGANSTLAVGMTAGVSGTPARSRALIKFDIAAGLPADAIVTSATFKIKVTKTPSPSMIDSLFDLRRVLQSWTEGKKTGDTGSAAAAGETTWRARSHSAIPANATLWTVPGGGTNTDFSATVSASTMVRGVGTYTFGSTPELVADVQAWLQDTNSNQGWILLSQAEQMPRTARRLGARERTANDRPSLTLEYTVPTTRPPPKIQSVQKAADTFSFAFATEANQAYAVEFTEGLPTLAWQALTNIMAQTLAGQIIVSDGSVTNIPQRFYRVRLP